MLELKELYKTFNPGTINAKTALNGLSLTLNDGDFVTVIGGNGAGKSTMLNAIAGVFPVDSGSILIDGQDVTKLPEHKRAALLGRVFQDPMMGTAPTMMIEENLALAARRGQRRGLGLAFRGFNGNRRLFGTACHKAACQRSQAEDAGQCRAARALSRLAENGRKAAQHHFFTGRKAGGERRGPAGSRLQSGQQSFTISRPDRCSQLCSV